MVLYSVYHCRRSRELIHICRKCSSMTSYRVNSLIVIKNVSSLLYFFPSFLKGQCHEIFDFWFFSWISFPQASEYTTTAISNFFENSRRYSRLKVHHRCQRHRWQMEKIFKQKKCNNFVWAPIGSRVNRYINFCLQVHFKVSVAWYCFHYLPPVSTTPAENLPPVSLIPVAICHRRRWPAANLPPVSLTPVSCQQHKGNWWQNLPPVSLKPVANLPPVSLKPAANLPPVSLTPVVHLDLRISPLIFEKIRDDPNVVFRGLWKVDSWKKPEAKNLVILSL